MFWGISSQNMALYGTVHFRILKFPLILGVSWVKNMEKWNQVTQSVSKTLTFWMIGGKPHDVEDTSIWAL